jgi:antirestriction protein ArdC
LASSAALRIPPFHPQAPSGVRGQRGKGWFHKNQKRPALFMEAGAAKGAEKMNVYAVVTDKIIKLLEQNVIPWRRPWTTAGLPRNLVSKKPYRGINLFLLPAAKYASPYWLTFKQANQLGGSVRKGENGEVIVFWKADRAANGETGGDAEKPQPDQKPPRRFVLKYFRVWNLEQCDLPQTVLDKLPRIETRQHDPIEAAERIVRDMPNPPMIQYGGSQAFYSPLSDRITLPSPECFTSAEDFYATLDHELIHAVGNPARLNRESLIQAAPFGSAVYSREELVAEMGAAFLCAEASIWPAVIANQAAYIQGWLAKLRGDTRLVVVAAAQAQRAADYVLNAGYKDQG